MRFCLDEEINKKQQVLFIAKAQFLVKIVHARHMAQMQTTMEMLKNWIYDNIDLLYNNKAITDKFLTKTISKRERDVKTIMANRSEAMRKEKLLDNILDYCENILIKRRARLYEKKIMAYKERTNHKINF